MLLLSTRPSLTIAMPVDGEWSSSLLKHTLAFLADITGNNWRRSSGGGPKRDAVADALVQQELLTHPSPPQLVVHPLEACKINPDAAGKAFASNDILKLNLDIRLAPPSNIWRHSLQFMNLRDYRPDICQMGFHWTRPSVWLLLLNLYPLDPEILGRHLLAMATMASGPGSALLVVYIEQPILQEATHLGFEVVFDKPFDEVAAELDLPPAGVKGHRVAKLVQHWQWPPTDSELRRAGLPPPLQDVPDFLASLPPDFVRTPIADIPQLRRGDSPQGIRIDKAKSSSEGDASATASATSGTAALQGTSAAAEHIQSEGIQQETDEVDIPDAVPFVVQLWNSTFGFVIGFLRSFFHSYVRALQELDAVLRDQRARGVSIYCFF